MMHRGARVDQAGFHRLCREERRTLNAVCLAVLIVMAGLVHVLDGPGRTHPHEPSEEDLAVYAEDEAGCRLGAGGPLQRFGGQVFDGVGTFSVPASRAPP